MSIFHILEEICCFTLIILFVMKFEMKIGYVRNHLQILSNFKFPAKMITTFINVFLKCTILVEKSILSKFQCLFVNF